jgi:hypothetical protein
MQKFHYVYRITNKINNKSYYGKRSSKTLPNKDLGIIYFSSSKTLKQDIKIYNLDNFKFKVIKTFGNAKDAIIFESKLHAKLNVKNNKNFYNEVNQTSNKFDTTDKACFLNTITNKYEHIFIIDKKDYHVGTAKNKITVIDNNGNTFSVNKDDPRIGNELNFISKDRFFITNIITNETRSVYEDDYNLMDKTDWRVGGKSNKNMIGKSTYKNLLTNEVVFLSNDDPRIGVEFVHVNKKTSTYINLETGEKVKLHKYDPRIGVEFVGVTKGFALYKNSITGKNEFINKNDPRIGNTHFHINKGYVTCININDNTTTRLHKDDPRIGVEYKSINDGFSIYKNIFTDEKVRLHKDDPRIGVEFVGSTAKKFKCINKNGDIKYLYKIDKLILNNEYKLI